MNDNPLFDNEPEAPANLRPHNLVAPHPAHASSFLIFIGWTVFTVCLIAGLIMYGKLEAQRTGGRDEYGNRRGSWEPDPYTSYYFPGALTLFMGSVQGLILVGLGMVVKATASQNQPRPATLSA